MGARTGRIPRTILIAAMALCLAPWTGGTGIALAQTDEQEDAGLTSETSYESPEFGFEVKWDDPWEVGEDFPTTERGGPDQIVLCGVAREEMRDQISIFAVATELSPSITLRPTLGTPDHICLIAVVGATNDPPSGSWNPHADGHYAQHNLDIVHVDAGGVGSFQFYAANPFREAARMTVRLRPASEAENRTLGALYAIQPLELAPDALRLMSATEAAADRPARELALTLDGGERRLCQGLVAAEGLRPGDVVAAEVETTAVPLRGERATELRGSFGVVVFVGR